MTISFIQDKTRFVALLLAAGSSTRMGNFGSTKPFLSLSDAKGVQTILERSLSALKETQLFAKIVLILRSEDLSMARSLIGESDDLVYIVGGATRSQSVRKGVEWLKENERADIVVIHDSARCLVSSDLVVKVAKAACLYGAASAAISVNDTIVQTGVQTGPSKSIQDRETSEPARADYINSSGAVITSALDRNNLRAIQTPQAFRFELLIRAHANNPEATDDTNLVQPFSKVLLVDGERSNIKITEPFDLELARNWLKKQP